MKVSLVKCTMWWIFSFQPRQ